MLVIQAVQTAFTTFDRNVRELDGTFGMDLGKDFQLLAMRSYKGRSRGWDIEFGYGKGSGREAASLHIPDRTRR